MNDSPYKSMHLLASPLRLHTCFGLLMPSFCVTIAGLGGGGISEGSGWLIIILRREAGFPLGAGMPEAVGRAE